MSAQKQNVETGQNKKAAIDGLAKYLKATGRVKEAEKAGALLERLRTVVQNFRNAK